MSINNLGLNPVTLGRSVPQIKKLNKMSNHFILLLILVPKLV